MAKANQATAKKHPVRRIDRGFMREFDVREFMNARVETEREFDLVAIGFTDARDE
jgi:hypothetical protein